MRDFELLRMPRRRSEVDEQTRTSTIYCRTETGNFKGGGPAGRDRETSQIDGRFLLRIGDARNAATLDYDFLVVKNAAFAIDQRGGLEDDRLSRGASDQERKQQR